MAPVKLQRALSRLPAPRDTTSHEIGSDDLDLARAALRGLQAGESVDLDRRLSKALIGLAGIVDSEDDRRLIAQTVLDGPEIGWRHLWRLWTSCFEDEPRVAHRLGQRLSQRLRSRPRFAERLPEWLPKSARQIPKALADPHNWAWELISPEVVPLWEVARRTEIAHTSRLGHSVLLDLIETADDDWWASMDTGTIRSWASSQSIDLLAAAADRMLVTLGGEAETLDELPKTKDQGALKTWILDRCGDPSQPTAAWQRMSERAQQVCELMLLADEIDKIFVEFRRTAETDRADYWQRFVPQMTDARYVDASGTAVCMMVVGGLLAVEFGLTGNACYFYEAPRVPLRTLTFGRRPKPADFKLAAWKVKARDLELPLGTTSVRFKTKKGHTAGRWKWDYDEILHAEGIRTPGRSRYS